MDSGFYRRYAVDRHLKPCLEALLREPCQDSQSLRIEGPLDGTHHLHLQRALVVQNVVTLELADKQMFEVVPGLTRRRTMRCSTKQRASTPTEQEAPQSSLPS